MIPLLVVAGAVFFSCVLVNIAAYRDFAAAKGRSRPTPRQLFTTPAFVAECAATIFVLANALLPTRRVAGPTGAQRRGIVFIVPPPRLPRGVLRVLRRRLHAQGWSTVFTRRVAAATPAEASSQLARILAAPTGPSTPVTVLAYGAAGLAARAYAATRAGDSPLRLVTLATPHCGTRSMFAPARLHADSSFLREIAALDPPGRTFDAVAIYSDFDAWVFPADDAYYPGAFNIEVRGIGHASMLLSNRVAGLILENLAASPPAPAA